MVDLRWDGHDFRNPQDSSGSTAGLISRSGKLQQGYFHGSLTRGLAAYYPINSGSGETLEDMTELENNGNINGTSWSTNSKIGSYCLNFDGTGDNVESAGFPSFVFTNPHTVSYWLKWDGLGSSWSPFISKQNSNTDGVHTWVGEDGKWDYTSSGNKVTADGNVPLDGTWQHLVIVNNGSSVKFYRNGTLDSSKSAGLGSEVSKPLRIGEDHSSNFGTGKIDDIRIYSRTLSRPEVESLYNITNPSRVSPEDTLI